VALREPACGDERDEGGHVALEIERLAGPDTACWYRLRGEPVDPFLLMFRIIP